MWVKGGAQAEWLVRERFTGREWCAETSDMAWEAGGFDPGRFEVHVSGERVVGTLDGYQGLLPSASFVKGESGWCRLLQRSTS